MNPFQHELHVSAALYSLHPTASAGVHDVEDVMLTHLCSVLRSMPSAPGPGCGWWCLSKSLSWLVSMGTLRAASPF